MFKGFFAGLGWGVLLAGLMVVVADEMAVRHELTDEPVASAVELPAGSAFDAVRTDMPPQAPGVADSLPVGAAPEAAPRAVPTESLPATGVTATAPSVPVTGDSAPTVTMPTEGGDMAAVPVAPGDGRPDLPPAAALTPDAPDAAPAAVEAAPPPAGKPRVGAGTVAPEAPVLPDSPPEALLGGGGDAPPDLDVSAGLPPDVPVAPGVEIASNGGFGNSAPDLPPGPATGVTRPQAPAEIASLEPPTREGGVALPPPGAVSAMPAAPGAPVSPGAGAAPEIAQAAAPLIEEPATIEPKAPGVAETQAAADNDDAPTPAQQAAQQIPTGRLVQAGVPDAPEAEAKTEADPKDADLPEDALSRNAAVFENPEDLPILSVVLLDGGDLPLDLPFQASFALDPLDPDAQTRALAYRAAGHEVLVLPALPEGASAQDAAQAIQGSQALLNQAVALIDSPDGVLQTSRGALEQVVAEALASGHGLVTFPRGLNSAQRVAQREGVTTGVVFRDIDAAGQDAAAVKRFLDQSAFRARQEGAVIVFARVRPDTVSGLAEWVLGNRAQSVMLAPVSAALKAGAGL